MNLADIFGRVNEQTFGVSLFRNRRDNTPSPATWTIAELGVQMRQFEAREEKDGSAWSPTIFDGKRSKEKAIEISCLVLDFDKGHDPSDFMDNWPQVRWFVHSTHSHTDESPRWRAVFPFAVPCPAAPGEEEKRWKMVHRYYADLLGGGVVDPVEDTARLYYLPASRAGAPRFAYESEGPLLDWRDVQVREAAQQEDRRTLNGSHRIGDLFNEQATWDEILVPHGWTRTGKRYGNLDLWQRPGEDSRDDHCARTGVGHIGDRFCNWSTDPSVSMFEPGRPYDKFGVFARLNHRGDLKAAAKAIADTLAVATSSTAGSPMKIAVRSEEEVSESGLPVIECRNRELREMTDDAIAAIIQANDPPTVFAKDGILVRIERDERGQRLIRPLTGKALRGVLARVADWVETGQKNQNHVAPPLSVVDDILSLGYTPDGIPPIEGITACPVVARNGVIQTVQGYDADSQWYLTDRIQLEEWSGDGASAAAWLLEEVFADFPFADQASRANTLGLFLLPFVRPLIDEPTPIHLVDAPTQGTGKSLLVKAALLPALGRIPAATPVPAQEEAFSKLLFSLLLEGKQTVFLDNVDRLLTSGALAAILTAGELSDRVLGLSSAPTVRVRCTLAATSNNGRLSEDIARRTVWIRLDAQMEDPDKRKGFKHPKILGWIRANRARIVSAALAMIRQWLAAGRPGTEARKGSFEEWCDVVGGILGACGIEGFIANDKELKRNANEEDAMWRAFVAVWHESFGERDVSVKQLRELAEEMDIMDPVFVRANSDRGRATAFGRALAVVEGKVYGGLSPRKSTMSGGLSRFKLARIGGLVDIIPTLSGCENNSLHTHDAHTFKGVGKVHQSTSDDGFEPKTPKNSGGLSRKSTTEGSIPGDDVIDEVEL